MLHAKSLIEIPEKIAEEIAEQLELDDPRKATRNAAVAMLLAGSLVAASLAQAAQAAEFYNPVITLGLFAVFVLVLPAAWRAGGLDVKLGLRLFDLHRRIFERRARAWGAASAPSYFRVRVRTQIRPWATAKMAFEPYSLSLTVGVIAWSIAVGIGPGVAPLGTPNTVLAAEIAALSMIVTLVATWVVPPIWLLRTSGLRVADPRLGTVETVDNWFVKIFGPLMGIASLGTIFIVYAIGGLPLRAALFAFAAISVTLFPVNFAATYLYRVRWEGKAAAQLAFVLRQRGVRTLNSLPEALQAQPRGP